MLSQNVYLIFLYLWEIHLIKGLTRPRWQCAFIVGPDSGRILRFTNRPAELH